MNRGLITLTTDFGGRDYFAGAMKGVILRINPGATIVDISHDIPSHDLWAAAYILGASYKYYPTATIHVVVVDPGVGSARRPILAVTSDHYFIGPDNGVLSFVYDDPEFMKAIHITSDHYFLPVTGSTFHGRDVFASAAAWLSKGIDSTRFGEEVTDYVRFEVPVARLEAGNQLTGEVVYIDKFGNCITNISSEDIKRVAMSIGLEKYQIVTDSITFNAVSDCYASLKRGEPGTVINGNGCVEVFVSMGDARRTLGFKRGDPVKVVFG